MKHLKRILIIIVLAFIAYCSYDIYTKMKQDNLALNASILLGTYNDVIDVTTPIESMQTSTNSNFTINGIEDTNQEISSPAKIDASNSASAHFFYQQLDDTGKAIYSKLENNISSLTKPGFKLDFSTQFNTLLNTSTGSYKLEKAFQSGIDAFLYDHPELFYIDLSRISLITKSRTIGTKTTYYVSLAPQSNGSCLYSQFSDPAVLNSAIHHVESIRQSFIKNVSGDTYHKVYQVHDTIVNLASYDTTYHKPNTHNIYGTFVDKSVVCEGYAKAMKYILDALNIPCILVSGTATNSSGESESHMWNYVQIDGQWYGIDATWDDPIIYINGKRQKETIRHDYLCKGSEALASSHIAEGKISDEGMLFSYPTLSRNDYR